LYVEKFYIFLRLNCLLFFRAIMHLPSFRAKPMLALAVIPSEAVNAKRSRHSERSRGISSHTAIRYGAIGMGGIRGDSSTPVGMTAGME
jgi:hypothetical protein